MRAAAFLVISVFLVTVAGCSGSREAAPAAGGRGTPGIDPDSRLDLDNGRVSVFSPRGWRRAPRSYDYLVRYQSTAQLPYPAVVVVAADPPEGFAEVTADNHAGFVEAITAAVGQGAVRAPTKAKAGAHLAAAWATAGEASLDGTPKKIERDCTAVVVDGRLYTVEAWAPRGKLTDAGRAAARAVAAALAVPALEPSEPLVPAEPVEPAAPAKPEEPAEPTEPEEPAATATAAPPEPVQN